MSSMGDSRTMHVLTIGWERILVEQLWNAIANRSKDRFSHLLHPRHLRSEWGSNSPESAIHFVRDPMEHSLPRPDRQLLESLEQEGVPTIHNMILGDRVVSRLAYDDALAYATMVARRMLQLFEREKPTVIIGGFDAIHSGIGLAVAKKLQIPWLALNFSVIPLGLACFCNRLSPAARVQLRSTLGADELAQLAESSLTKFEAGSISAYAYIEPPLSTIAQQFTRLPARISSLVRTIRNGQQRDFIRFTDGPGAYSVPAAVRYIRNARSARRAVSNIPALAEPPPDPYVLFGLHTQPESSIDVWAPFFSNQMWVIELLSRSVPASHKLLVKIHKSDTSSYTAKQLQYIRTLPGVDLVKPFADTRSFIEKADLVVAIQGTMGLEAALLGKPVIMLGESAVTMLPSASPIGAISELPELVRQKIAQPHPGRQAIVDAFAGYLEPFEPAGHNDWRVRKTDQEIDDFVRLFEMLKHHLQDSPATRRFSGEQT